MEKQREANKTQLENEQNSYFFSLIFRINWTLDIILVHITLRSRIFLNTFVFTGGLHNVQRGGRGASIEAQQHIMPQAPLKG